MRERARVVIVGGGVHGASLLWHLVQEGETDVLLVEKAELTSGSTWHAAGQITHSVFDYTTAAFHDYAIKLYEELEELTGQGISFHQPGGLRVAYTDLEMDAMKAQLGVGKYIGYPIDLISAAEAKDFNPFYDFTDVKGAIWTPEEGHVDPSGVTMAFANDARSKGAEISKRNRVLEINSLTNGEWEVVTEKGTVTCEHVVDAAGCYGYQVGQFTGLRVPQANILHHYLVTEEVPELAAWDREMPVMRDNRVAGYIRQEQTAALIGIYEHAGAEQIWDNKVPWDAENPLFPEDYDKIAPWLEESFNRLPIAAPLGIKRVIHGAITHTIDGHMLLGPVPGHKNFWLNTGSSIGLAWGPGAGRELARWILHGTTELSLRHYDPRRFGYITDDSGDEYIKNKAIEDYEWMFRVHPPGEERLDHRPVWTSTVHDALVAKGAYHGQAYGWEQPKWFAPLSDAGERMQDQHGWYRPDWYDTVRKESDAVRNAVGIMDLSAFSKYDITGPDAHGFLNYLTTGIVPTTVGRIGLNYVLTPTARVETEITVTCLAPNHYYVISGPMGQARDLDWFMQNRTKPDGTGYFDVTIEDRTTTSGTLVLAGPNARKLLASCTDADVSNDAHGFLRAQQIEVCGIPLRALRVGFTGSLGWELHAPMDRLLDLYNGLWAQGADLGLRDFGAYALNSLRMEKGYLTRFELTHDIGPRQAGVDRWLRPERKEFIGKDALGGPPTGDEWKLVYMRVDVEDGPDAADCIGGEGVFRDGNPVGLTTSGGYGFTVEQSLAFAYVRASAADAGTNLTIMILGEHIPAIVLDAPVYDVENNELRA